MSKDLFPKLSERAGVCYDYYSTDTRPTDYPLHYLSPEIWFYDYNYSPHIHKPNGTASSTLYPLPNQYQTIYNVKNANTVTVGNIAGLYPGKKWLLGNEPDVASQSNNTPTEYALGYKNLYNAIKAKDPTSMIYVGGIGSMSQARMAWLGEVTTAYQSNCGSALPCDGWHVHGYIVEEIPGAPGINHPVGLAGSVTVRGGTAWADHTNKNVFKSDVKRMRQWMKDKGYQNKPLIISEYGCLLPSLGWGKTPEVQGQFVKDTFDFMLYEKDTLGCPLDNNKLVQEFALFSANYDGFPDGRLFGVDKKITKLGKTYRKYWYSNFFDVALGKEDEKDLYTESGSLMQTNTNIFGE